MNYYFYSYSLCDISTFDKGSSKLWSTKDCATCSLRCFGVCQKWAAEASDDKSVLIVNSELVLSSMVEKSLFDTSSNNSLKCRLSTWFLSPSLMTQAYFFIVLARRRCPIGRPSTDLRPSNSCVCVRWVRLLLNRANVIVFLTRQESYFVDHEKVKFFLSTVWNVNGFAFHFPSWYTIALPDTPSFANELLSRTQGFHRQEWISQRLSHATSTGAEMIVEWSEVLPLLCGEDIFDSEKVFLDLNFAGSIAKTIHKWKNAGHGLAKQWSKTNVLPRLKAKNRWILVIATNFLSCYL